jgi:hypothetical protein
MFLLKDILRNKFKSLKTQMRKFFDSKLSENYRYDF